MRHPEKSEDRIRSFWPGCRFECTRCVRRNRDFALYILGRFLKILNHFLQHGITQIDVDRSVLGARKQEWHRSQTAAAIRSSDSGTNNAICAPFTLWKPPSR